MTEVFFMLVAQYGSAVMPLASNLTALQNVRETVAAGLSAFGRIDVAVTTAGYAEPADIEEIGLGAFRRQLDVNLFGVVHVVKSVLPTMREQRTGRLIHVPPRRTASTAPVPTGRTLLVA